MRIINLDDGELPPPAGFDLRDVMCPRCGAWACERDIVRPPIVGSWLNGIGRARCSHCGYQYGLRVISEFGQ